MALDFFSAWRRPAAVAIPMQHIPAPSFFDRERTPLLPLPPPGPVTPHYIVHMLASYLAPGIAAPPIVLLVAPNRQRVGLGFFNETTSGVLIADTATLVNGLTLTAGSRFEFPPPPIPENAIYGRAASMATGALRMWEILRVDGEDYQAMQDAIGATGTLPVIGSP